VNAYAAIREHHRMTQAEWALAFGVARSTISAWELDEAIPPPVVQGAYRKLQQPILDGDLARLDANRAFLLDIAGRAAAEADRLNRERAAAAGTTKLLAVTAAAVAIGLLLAHLYSKDRS
jgi:transcriptional regulator with XRE-family HTH domain